MNKHIKSIICGALSLIVTCVSEVPAEEALSGLLDDTGFIGEFQAPTEPKTAGQLVSTGTHFELKDSKYLNVTIDSSEPIYLVLESVPELVTMRLESTTDAVSTQITLNGFAPETTYHKYEDDYHNHEAFTTDSHGSYTYFQDLSAPHTIFIQPKSSTKFIRDDATGGDCSSIGLWDSFSKTCTITTDLSETIQIDSDGITLDGNNHALTGNNTGNGIFLSGRTGVTIKGITISKFSTGVYLSSSSNNTISGINASNNTYGIYLWVSNNNFVASNKTSNNAYGIHLMSSSSNALTNNTASKNDSGIALYRTGDSARMYPFSNNILRGNIMTDNSYNFTLWGWTDNVYDNDIDTSNLVDGKPIYYIKYATNQTYDASTNAGVFYCVNCDNITVDGLTLAKNGAGLVLVNTHNSKIANVNASNNRYSGILLYSSDNNTLIENIASENTYPGEGTGIKLFLSNKNVLSRNIASFNGGAGIVLSGIRFIGSNDNLLTDNTVSNNGAGIALIGSNNNTISNNTAMNNLYGGYYSSYRYPSGIYLQSSAENILTGNNVLNNGYGILLYFSSNYNLISGNNAANNYYSGIYLWAAIYNSLEDNTINSNSLRGIAISHGPVTLKGNIMTGNKYNFALPATLLGTTETTIDPSNLVDGKPIYYIKGASNQVYDASINAGAFYCINCSNVTVEGLTLTNNGIGLGLYNTQGSTIRNITVSNNSFGISLYSSGNNTIYNNNFLNNERQTNIYGTPSNVFNLSVPLGGNYWSIYDSLAEGCNDSNSDGFCDTPYVFTGGQDNLPWNKQDGWKGIATSIKPVTAVTASDTPCDNGGNITLNWTFSQDDPASGLGSNKVTGYNIYRSISSGGPYGLIGSVSAGINSYVDTDAVIGTTYYYIAMATDGIKESVNSIEASATSARNLPLPPTNLTALDTQYDLGGSVTLSWMKSADDGVGLNNVLSYNIYRYSSTNNNIIFLTSVPVGTISYADNTTVDTDTYYYSINALDRYCNLESPASNVASGQSVNNLTALSGFITTLPGISPELVNSLTSKVENAVASYDRGNENAAINQLDALLNEIAAQSGKKIDATTVGILAIYIQNLINHMMSTQ